ncbi:helix-turn-helix domain-containing protein [Halorussus salinus]|uniref:helix-turn-helix domain-containing protein n=1 Tax=Halorussus salinus TaxID=1364935 RepID=UPI0010919C39|nr:helix-turn-helix domain-containing protein [Halorussus salinus]
MTLIADFYLETPVLRPALEAAPEMDVTIEQQTSRAFKPFALAFWASNGDFEAFDAGLADDPTIGDVTLLAEMEDQRLYQVELTDEGDEQMTYHSWADQGGVFVSSERAGDGWRSRIRFPDRDSLRNYADFCEEHGLTFELRQLYDAGEPDDDSFGLTDRQYETLRTATEMGYFDVPRAVELEDLADRLGVSRQAVSERLRRATETLVRATIFRQGAVRDRDE